MAAAFLANFLFWSGIAIGAVALTALVDVSGGEWLGPMRGIAERFRRFLPVSFALFVVLMWRRADVYPWARSASDPWFAQPLLIARDAVALALVYGAAFVYGRRSTRASAVAFLIVYAVGFSVASVDLVMSLEPRWTSTLFPAYVLTGNVYAGTAAVATCAAWMGRSAIEMRNGSSARDAANLLVGLALFWMYLFWSQFLVIWYGNLTSEVGFIMSRVGTSHPLGWIVLTLCWAAPTIVFVPRWGKRIPALRAIGIVILIGCWCERWLLVSPDLQPTSVVATAVVSAAFAALFGLSVAGSGLAARSARRARQDSWSAPDRARSFR